MRKLTLDKMYLISMLGDDAFYKACPIFLFMRQSAQEAHGIFMERVKKGLCDDCSQDGTMTPLVKLFLTHIKEQFDLDPANLECIRGYLQSKKGYPVGEIVVPYKTSKGLLRF
jgi:hypothetical protein